MNQLKAPPPTVFVGPDMQDDSEHSKSEIARILQAIQDSINIQLLPSWLRLLIKLNGPVAE